VLGNYGKFGETRYKTEDKILECLFSSLYIVYIFISTVFICIFFICNMEFYNIYFFDIKEIYIKKQYSISFFRESFLAIGGILFFYGILIFTSLLQKNIDGAMVGLDYFLFSMPFL